MSGLRDALTGMLGAAMLAVAGWVFQLGTRVPVLEPREPIERESLDKLLDQRFGSIDQRLERIERVMNGLLKDHH